MRLLRGIRGHPVHPPVLPFHDGATIFDFNQARVYRSTPSPPRTWIWLVSLTYCCTWAKLTWIRAGTFSGLHTLGRLRVLTCLRARLRCQIDQSLALRHLCHVVDDHLLFPGAISYPVHRHLGLPQKVQLLCCTQLGSFWSLPPDATTDAWHHQSSHGERCIVCCSKEQTLCLRQTRHTSVLPRK